MSDQIIVLPISKEELKGLLSDAIREVINLDQPRKEDVELLTVKQLADFFQVKTPAVYKWISNKSIPFIKNGKNYYFNKSDILKTLSHSDVESYHR